MVGDGNCLYRAAAKGAFGSDSAWSLIKLGALLVLHVEAEDFLNEVYTIYVSASLEDELGINKNSRVCIYLFATNFD